MSFRIGGAGNMNFPGELTVIALELKSVAEPYCTSPVGAVATGP